MYVVYHPNFSFLHSVSVDRSTISNIDTGNGRFLTPSSDRKKAKQQALRNDMEEGGLEGITPRMDR